jgi:hypothetical protein
MRFCPFCAAENVDEATHCAVCARKLPAQVRKKTIAVPIAPAAGGELRPATQPASEPDLRVPPTAELKRVAEAPKPAPVEPPKPVAEPPKPVEVKPEPKGENGVSATSPTPAPPPVDDKKRDATTSGYATQLVPVPEVENARPKLVPMPRVPEGGLIEAARYALAFARARWQRKKAISSLSAEIEKETEILDGVLLELGKAGRARKLEQRVFSEENKAIDDAENRRGLAEQAVTELTGRKTEENARFDTIHKDLAARVSERDEQERIADRAQGDLEGQRRSLRDKRKDIERRQRGLGKQADQLDEQAAQMPMGEARAALRRQSEDLRAQSAQLNHEKDDIEGRLSGLEKPLADAVAAHDLAKGELDAARKDLENAKEGHRHRLAEIEAEQLRRTKELSNAENEIQRRLVTLGTLVNLHRVEGPELVPLYGRCDELRAAIGAQESEIERLTTDMHAYDKGSLVRGAVVLGAAVVGLITIIWLIVAIV